MSDLMPCPFCGNDEPYIEDGRIISIECYDCGVTTPKYNCDDITLEEVVDDWNRRGAEQKPTIADYLEANKEMIGKTKAKMVSISSLVKFMEGENE